QQAAFFQQVLQELAVVPAVHAVGVAENLPLTGFSEMVIVRFEGHPSPVFGRDQPIGHTSVSPDYFHVLGTPLRRGRMLDEHDNETAPSVALVNEALVRRYFPDEDPIGKRFPGPRSEWTSIVGVVGDIRQNGLEGDSLPEIYRPYLQSPRSFMMLALRTSDD